MSEYAKPLPVPSPISRPFFEAVKRHELVVMRCRACGTCRLIERETCPECWSNDYEWVRASGRGSVYSFVVMHQRLHPAFAGDIPYNVALIDLEEGPRLVSNIVGCPNEALKVSMAVEVVFDDVSDELTLPRFRPTPA